MKDIEFVSYDGGYPNLCSGTLLLRVDGVIVGFNGCLNSGGAAYFTNGYADEIIEHGPWTFDVPVNDEGFESVEEFEEYYAGKVDPPIRITEDEREYIEFLVNKNVPQGCCGGCL